MATTTIKMGKRGTIVLPVKLRKQFGLGDGSLLVTEARDGEIRSRPAFVYEPEAWSPQRKAYLTLINAMTQEEFDEVSALLREEGIDPTDAPGLDPNHRSTLPTNAEWEAHRELRRAELLKEKRIA
jgi:bifunctional DNA-binding transcriptional regulator/antitoxin component of YhaV-PrlF toxin-antitoxin module